MAKVKNHRAESQKHLEAYEYYYVQGDERTLASVAKKFNVEVQTIYQWRKNYGWDQRIQKRNRSIQKKVSAKSDIAIVSSKKSYRKEISKNMSLVKGIMSTIIDAETGALLLKVKSVYEFVSLISAYESLIRLDLDIVGNDDDNQYAPIFKLTTELSRIMVGKQTNVAIAIESKKVSDDFQNADIIDVTNSAVKSDDLSNDKSPHTNISDND